MVKSRSLCFAGLLLLQTSCSTTRQPAPSFASVSINSPEFFPILPWDPYHQRKPQATHPAELEGIADCNFNLASFVMPSEVASCEKLGLGAIVFPAEADKTGFSYTPPWSQRSDAEIDQRIKSMVEAAGRSPAVVGFFIADEPGVKDFPGLAKAVAAVKKYAPGKMAYINLFPDYATLGAPDKSQLGTENYTEYLERFVNEVHPQFISYDNYMVQYSQDQANPGVAASYYRNLLEVRRVAQEHNLPFLNIVASSQIVPEGNPPSPANLMFQTYTTLAAGYRGVTWYTYYKFTYPAGPIDESGRKTSIWPWLQEVNREVVTLEPVLSKLTSTGVFFSAPTPVENLPLLPGKLIESVTCPTPLMIGEFKGREGEPYVMVVNLSLTKSAKFKIKTAQAYGKISVISAMDGKPTALHANGGYWLTAGQGVLMALEK